jgi:flagellar hook protein FlgE
MSLYGALLTGVSSLNANGRALSITSSNIANVNTVGYKTSTADFSTFLASTGSASVVTPSSVQVSAAQHLSQQGLLTTTASSTDLAITGNGFFIVTPNPANPLQTYYTRAGSFTADSEGLLKNAAGFYLEGWTLNPDGTMPSNRSALSVINLQSINGTAEATTQMSLNANLQASAVPVGAYAAGDMYNGVVTPEFEQTINVYDTQGAARPMQLAFVKTGADTWAYEVSYQGNPADIGGVANNPINAGTMTFNADGTLASPAGGIANFTIAWDASTGLTSQPMAVNFGTVGLADGVTQFDAPSAISAVNVDGAPYGSITAVTVDEEGYVSALFDNGIQRRVFKVALATFVNPDGLAPIAGNAYQLTDEAGIPSVLEPGTGGAGSIASNALEASTVDLAREFSDLITTQRAYSAATRIITTADQMLQELMQIKQ